MARLVRYKLLDAAHERCALWQRVVTGEGGLVDSGYGHEFDVDTKLRLQRTREHHNLRESKA